MAHVALAWVLKHPVVTAPIVGATKPHHLPDAVAALDVQLTDDEIRTLEEPYASTSADCVSRNRSGCIRAGWTRSPGDFDVHETHHRACKAEL